MDLPLSDFLIGAKSHLGDEITDRILDDSAIEHALHGNTVPREGKVKSLVGEAYEKLKTFIKANKAKTRATFIAINSFS